MNISTLAWDKMNGLLPAIVQDSHSGAVLMLGYMNPEAIDATLASGKVTFFSRSKNRLWTKGETSGHELKLIKLIPDCDQDSLLVIAEPIGPTCHTGTSTCYGNEAHIDWQVITQLEATIDSRYKDRPPASYTTQLFNEGLERIAQKVGEEGVEVALAAVTHKPKALLCGEVADLLFHTLVLLRAQHLSLKDVIEILQRRA